MEPKGEKESLIDVMVELSLLRDLILFQQWLMGHQLRPSGDRVRCQPQLPPSGGFASRTKFDITSDVMSGGMVRSLRQLGPISTYSGEKTMVILSLSCCGEGDPSSDSQVWHGLRDHGICQGYFPIFAKPGIIHPIVIPPTSDHPDAQSNPRPVHQPPTSINTASPVVSNSIKVIRPGPES